MVPAACRALSWTATRTTLRRAEPSARGLAMNRRSRSHPTGVCNTMSGIHHVTAISGRASRNLEFYTRVLGLRFVKKTVNFDDPGTYHLYYGDEQGHPGTILTFFPWEQPPAGRNGDGLTEGPASPVPAASMGSGTHRFIEHGVAHEALERRFGDPVLASPIPTA